MRKIFTLLLIAFLSVSAQAQGEAPFVPGELLVQVTDNAKVDLLLDDLKYYAGVTTGVDALELLSDHMRIWRFSFDADAVSSRDMKMAFDRHPLVSVVQYNHYVQMREVPNDPNYGNQWHHNDPQDNDIDTQEAWDVTTGGTTSFGDEIVVCVIEGGNLNHPDLSGNRWFNDQEIPDNGVDDDGNGYIDDYDGWNVSSNDDSGVFNGGHGTQVMGMIGAKGNNDLGVVGANWDVKIMSVAGENIFDESSVIEAYDYPLQMRKLYNETGGTQGAFVVATNASWGIDNGDPADIPLWCQFYDTLGTYGVLNCGATANNNVNIDVVGDIPTACSSDYMISVTATNSSDVRTFSAYGATTIDLGAPGESVWTTQGSNGYGGTSGTSFASPLTAGAIALIYSTPCPSFMSLVHADPHAGADYVRQVLFEGTDPIANLEDECVTGGRLNVNNSISLILSGCSDSECLTPFAVNVSSVGETHTVSWGATAAMLGFDLRYRMLGDLEWTEVLDLTENTYDLTGLDWCATYEVEVMAFCAEGESAWSSTVTFDTEGCCENPDTATIMATSVTESTATIIFESVLAAESYNIVLTPAGGGNPITVNGATENSVLFENLEACTVYEVTVQAVCANETLNPTAPITFNTSGCGACADLPFCVPGGFSDEEWIDRVELVTLDSQSGNNGGYGDYTGDATLTTVLDPGGTYAMTLTPGFGGFAYDEYFVVWIDLNADGEFTANEVVLESTEGSADPVSANISIPVSATQGSSRLRVGMKYVGGFGDPVAPLPCEDLDYGEYEDYCVTISDNIINISEAGGISWNLYPNPTNGQLNIALPAGSYTIELLDMTGRILVQEAARGSRTLNVSAFAEGVYFVRLLKDGKVLATERVIRR